MYNKELYAGLMTLYISDMTDEWRLANFLRNELGLSIKIMTDPTIPLGKHGRALYISGNGRTDLLALGEGPILGYLRSFFREPQNFGEVIQFRAIQHRPFFYFTYFSTILISFGQ